MIQLPVTTDPAEAHLLAPLDHTCEAEAWQRITSYGHELDEAVCVHCGMAHYRAPRA